MLRTPNMEGPTANSSLYVTLAHEYEFCKLESEIASRYLRLRWDQFHDVVVPHPTMKQRVGAFSRWPFSRRIDSPCTTLG